MRATVVIIGAGHCGLAMSRCLTQRSIDHLVLERGEVANAWKRQRWDSLRLLTPNWQCRLPGQAYDGGDPDGFMDKHEVAAFVERYADIIDAPVQTHTTVSRLARDDAGYRVETDRGSLGAAAVVIASGACALPRLPAFADQLPTSLTSIAALAYRNPEQLPPGGVLVVGASATGVQLAREIHRSGRPVTLSVGEHVRAPRSYRGKDIQWWLDATGVLDTRYDEVDDLVRARTVPSPQLVGDRELGMLDLNALSALGIRLVGKLAGVRDRRLLFSGSLANCCKLADLKLGRLLSRCDEWAASSDCPELLEPAIRFEPTRVPASPPLELDLSAHGIESVVWATGYRPDYRYVDVPVLDDKGGLRHDGGVVEGAPGMYVMGTSFLRRRKSSFIHGAADDARDLSAHLAGHLARPAGPLARSA